MRVVMALFGAFAALAGCVDGEPVVDGGLQESARYGAAAKRAALLLTGAPAPADVVDGISSSDKTAKERYLEWIDVVIDPTRNPALGASLRRFFLDDMALDDRVVTVEHPQARSLVDVSLADGADLATFLVLEREPFLNLVTDARCVRPANRSAALIASPNEQLAFDVVPCANDSPVAAGLLTQQGFLMASRSTTGFERVRTWKYYLACEDQTQSDDVGWVSCNTCAGNPDEPLSPSDPAGPDPRMHAKYAVPSNESWCATCHHWLNPRRPLFIKYDEEGFYRRGRTLFDAETPENNFGRCVTPPVGVDVEALEACTDPGYLGPQETDWQYGCCYDPLLTDANATITIPTSEFACVDPEKPFCTGQYYGENINDLSQLGETLRRGESDGKLFERCAATRFANFLLGRDRGQFRDRTDLRPPAPLPPELLAPWREAFAAQDHDALELLRAILLSDAFLDAAVTP